MRSGEGAVLCDYRPSQRPSAENPARLPRLAERCGVRVHAVLGLLSMSLNSYYKSEDTYVEPNNTIKEQNAIVNIAKAKAQKTLPIFA